MADAPSQEAGPAVKARLRARELTLAYERRVVVDGLDLDIPDGAFTVIIGPNACGKSTLLRALARVLAPRAGVVQLDGDDLSRLPGKEAARRLGLLPQTPIAPDAITVGDLVARGRYPHQRLLRQWTRRDERVIADAMAATGVSALADRGVDELSGGQRQRVWLAMALAQETDILLLDEPTTYLDVAHQLDVLDLCVALNTEGGRTLVAVLHDLNLACRYADHLVVMSGGQIVATGPPAQVVDAALLADVFGLACRVVPDPETGGPLIVPLARHAGRGAAGMPAGLTPGRPPALKPGGTPVPCHSGGG